MDDDYDGYDDSGEDSDSSDSSDSSSEAGDENTELYDETDETSQELMEESDTPEKGGAAEKTEAPENPSSNGEKAQEEAGKSADKTDETDTTEDTDKTEESDEVDEETKAEIAEKSEYSQEVNDHIHSVEELEVYQKAGLHEQEVDGRICLVRDDIDPNYVDEKTGLTNQELMEKGRAPIDAKTGERIELHHIGQDYDSPLAELTATEHDTSALHTKTTESWRSDSEKNNHYNNVERPGHWRSRA